MPNRGNILIVDDTPANLRLLASMLGERGYKVRPANNGMLALDAAHALTPDLVLLDVRMPGMDGYQVCRQLKADEQTRDIPIIFISALDEVEDKVKGFAAGGVDYVTKPFQFDEVLARVEVHLALRNMQKKLEEQNARLEQEIADRVRAEEALHRYNERLKILNEINQSILAAQSSETIAVAALSYIRLLIPCQRAVVMTVEEGGLIETLAAESSGKIGPRADAGIYQEMFRGQSLSNGRVRGAVDLATLSRRSPMQQALYAAGVRSYLVVPLFVHDELVGTLNLDADSPRAFTPDHITIATEVAVLLAVAIRQVRLYERAQREIVERMQAEESLRQRTLELEARNAELDAFAHTVAHDLKNPLTSLIGYSSLLERRFTEMSEERVCRNLQVIGQNGRKMSNIVDELLLLASVREVEEIETQALDMRHIVAEAQERLVYLIEEHQAEITLLSEKDWPVASGYGPWVEEVWVNYISNALKYGGRPPRVELGFDAVGGEQNPPSVDRRPQIRFWVRDNGPGLAAEEQARLFTPFERLHRVRAEGHGLGLSIVQRIVEKLRGRVGVESQVGQESTFWFTLPAPQDDVVMKKSMPAPGDPTRRRHRRAAKEGEQS